MTPQEKQTQVQRLHRQGLTATQIATDIQANPRTVYRYLKKLRLSIPHPRCSYRIAETDKSIIQNMLNDGMSYTEISRTTGHDIKTIRRHFPGRGWTTHQAIEHGTLIRNMRGILA